MNDDERTVLLAAVEAALSAKKSLLAYTLPGGDPVSDKGTQLAQACVQARHALEDATYAPLARVGAELRAALT